MSRSAISNRNYKDSVFVDIFSEDARAAENFLSLYNALHSRKVERIEGLKNIRLKNVLYMSFYNDVSYLVGNKIIVLAEHQSTINPNMPLRCLEYVSRLYEKLFERKEKYSRKLLHIAAPEFYVFYNGEGPYFCERVLKLSHAFGESNEQPNLELIVKVININQQQGKHHHLLEVCRPMYEYSVFVDTVRKWKRKDRENGFERAIEECIANDILREYLKRKTKEVLNMLISEYDYETDIAVQRAEEREIAFAEGIERGIEQGIERGIEQGIERGIEQGIERGIERGIEQGIERGIEQGIERGIEQGKSLGLAEGVHQKAVETAKAMLHLRYPIEDVCKISGLSAAEIAAL